MPQITFFFTDGHGYETGKRYTCEMNLLDPKKLYGWTEVKHFGDNGEEVRKIHLDSSGIVKMEEKSTAFQYFDHEGNNLDKADLYTINPVDMRWNQLFYKTNYDPLPSSFVGGVPLKFCKPEHILNIEIDAVYELVNIQADELMEEVADRVCRFDFVYHQGGKKKEAFLLVTAGHCFVLTGNSCNSQLIKVNEESHVSLEDFARLGDDELDFNLL